MDVSEIQQRLALSPKSSARFLSILREKRANQEDALDFVTAHIARRVSTPSLDAPGMTPSKIVQFRFNSPTSKAQLASLDALSKQNPGSDKNNDANFNKTPRLHIRVPEFEGTYLRSSVPAKRALRQLSQTPNKMAPDASQQKYPHNYVNVEDDMNEDIEVVRPQKRARIDENHFPVVHDGTAASSSTAVKDHPMVEIEEQEIFSTSTNRLLGRPRTQFTNCIPAPPARPKSMQESLLRLERSVAILKDSSSVLDRDQVKVRTEIKRLEKQLISFGEMLSHQDRQLGKFKVRMRQAETKNQEISAMWEEARDVIVWAKGFRRETEMEKEKEELAKKGKDKAKSKSL